MTIKQLQKLCHKIAKEKGFWSKECNWCFGTGKIIAQNWKTTKEACEYCEGTGQVPIERNNSELLMLIVSELGEACEALRKDDNKNFREEIADAIIRIADLCGGLNIDLEKEILKKMRKNRRRPYKHGKKF